MVLMLSKAWETIQGYPFYLALFSSNPPLVLSYSFTVMTRQHDGLQDRKRRDYQGN